MTQPTKPIPEPPPIPHVMSKAYAAKYYAALAAEAAAQLNQKETMNTIENRVKEVIAGNLGRSVADLKPEARLIEDLGADSLDLIEIVMDIEGTFDFDADDDEAEKVLTVQQAVDFVIKHAPQ